MIDAVHKALYAFWSSFGVPAYLMDRVPIKVDDQGRPMQDEDKRYIPIDPPYITFEVEDGDFGSTSYVTAISWHRAYNGSNVNRERAQLMDAIAEAIPTEGVLVELEGEGYIKLERNPSGFQQYYTPDDDISVVGGLTNYTITYYHL